MTMYRASDSELSCRKVLLSHGGVGQAARIEHVTGDICARVEKDDLDKVKAIVKRAAAAHQRSRAARFVKKKSKEARKAIGLKCEAVTACDEGCQVCAEGGL